MKRKGVMKRTGMLMIALLAIVAAAVPAAAGAMPNPRYPYGFEIDQTAVTLEKGELATLTVSGGAAMLGTTTWTSSDEAVAVIASTESGSFGLSKGYRAKVRAQATGTAMISARNSKNSTVLTCMITVEGAGTGSEQTEGTEVKAELKTPVITSTTNSGTSKAGKLSVKWNQVEGADQYQVQISDSIDFTKTKVDKKTKNTSYSTAWNYYNYVGSGTKNPTYYYRVKAISSDGAESLWSEIVSCPAS